MILITALGNPGEKYKNTRHNVGFIILDNILGEVSWSKSSSANALIYKDSIKEEEVEYLKPQTFMNDSGISVAFLKKKNGISSSDIIVIHDDIDLPLGKLKISYDRGDGGHNGVKSIMNHIQSESFVRIRVGVSILGEDNIVHKPNVLGSFSKTELEFIEKDISSKVCSILEIIVSRSLEEAMNKYN